MPNKPLLPATLRALRTKLDLTQERLAERLGVSFATVNRWEAGTSKPQRAQAQAIAALVAEAGVGSEDVADAEAALLPRRLRRSTSATKSMEQMLWDAACSIHGEKAAFRFRDYLLSLLFLKRLSDVFDDEITRLAENYDDRASALAIVEADHSLLRFYLPLESRWAVIREHESLEWPLDTQGYSTKPRDLGEHLTRAMRAVVMHNPLLQGVIDVVDFAVEHHGEREIDPSRLHDVIEAFSDPCYRLGLSDVQPDFLGGIYEHLLRKFSEVSGQSAGEFFTPGEVGSLMAHILRPYPGKTCHDYACGSAGLLIKLQEVARELDPTSRVPLALSGQELLPENYAMAHMNAIIHDMDVTLVCGDSLTQPGFCDANGKISTYDIVLANPVWNQTFSPELFRNDPFERFQTAGGSSSRGDWAWVQHTLACLSSHGRAAVVLDTGAVTRGSGAKTEDKERHIRKWFVDNDLIDGVILLPENLFYNTTAAGVILVLNRHKPAARKGRITLLNASKYFKKGKPKNTLSEEDIKPLAAAYLKGEPVKGEITVISTQQAEEADYNLSPARWVGQSSSVEITSLGELVKKLKALSEETHQLSTTITRLLAGIVDESTER